MKRKKSKNKNKHLGRPPGSPVFTGSAEHNKVEINLITYDEQKLSEFKDISINDLKGHRQTLSGIFWIDVVGFGDKKVFEELGEMFKIHPITMEGIMDVYQSPRLEELDDYMLYSMKKFDVEKELQTNHISFILGKDFIISFSEESSFEPVKERIRGHKGRIRRMKADYLFYSLIDLMVDHYLSEMEKINDIFDRINDDLMADPGPELLQQIHYYRPYLKTLRRILFPLREMNNQLLKEDFAFINTNLDVYLRNLYDHSIHVVEMVEMLKDSVSGLLDIYLSVVSNKMNEVMKVLTIFAAIFIPLTFMAGWYGMNFNHMPELASPLAYPLFILGIIGVSVIMLLFFRKKGWIGKKKKP